MRSLKTFVALVLLIGSASVSAQEPAVGTAQPVGNLAEFMRAILFPNSNILFDVQVNDPEAIGEKKEGDSVSSTFSGIYKGWQLVEQAAIVLAEVESLIMLEGRLCENGKPVPTAQEDYQRWARQLTDTGKEVLAAARKKDRDTVSDLTNQVAGACEDCHTKYRRYQDRCTQ